MYVANIFLKGEYLDNSKHTIKGIINRLKENCGKYKTELNKKLEECDQKDDTLNDVNKKIDNS